MKKRVLAFLTAVCMICALTMTSCSAAEVPAAGGSAGIDPLAFDAVRAAGFSDVPADAWYADAVDYCRRHDIMSGTSADTFTPEGTLTRAMLAAILYRMSDAPAVSEPPVFTDADAGSWYSDAVSWAAKSGRILGYGGGIFGVDDPVTREQAVTILWRCAGSPENTAADSVSDANAVSAWAQEAVRWANAGGILDGMLENRRFAPDVLMKRGEAASMLYHYLEQAAGLPEASSGLTVSFNGRTYSASLADNSSAEAFAALLREGPLTISAHDYGGFEKVGALGTSLPRNDEQVTTAAGDIILYQGDQITLYYAQNTWRFTRLGRLDDPSGLPEALGDGDVEITFTLTDGQGSAGNPGGFDFAAQSVTLNSGYEMPINGLGTYSLHGETCIHAVKSALASGVRLIDTASAYGNEEEVGRAVREAMEELGIRREDIFITTKIYPGSEMEDPESSVQACLDRLGLDYVDMMLLHHPDSNDVKAYKAMEQFAREGKIRSLGLSNWYVKELEEFLPQVSVTPALVQNEIHPYYQENDVIPYIQSLGIAVQGWYPLGGRGHTGELLGNEVICGIAEAHGVSSAQVILRWNLQKGVVVIPGSSNPDHIRENTELYGFALSAGEMEQINALDRNEKHDWY